VVAAGEVAAITSVGAVVATGALVAMGGLVGAVVAAGPEQAASSKAAKIVILKIRYSFIFSSLKCKSLDSERLGKWNLLVCFYQAF
jgi:hypothetical protein